MKRLFTLAATLLVLGASTASAQSGLTMYWDNCSDGGTNQKTFACNANSGSQVLICSVIIPNDMTLFAAASAIVDIKVDGGALPAWWQTNTGECRAGAIGVTFDPLNIGGNCPDLWGGNSNLSVFQAQPGINGADWLRLNSGAAIPAGSEIAITADGTELSVCKITVTRAKSTGTGACAGCITPACIVFNESWLQQPAGNPGYRVTNEAAGKTRSVTWQGTPAGCPESTPAQNRTWGAVKNLYR